MGNALRFSTPPPHHSTENLPHLRSLSYRVAMAPTGLRFLTGNQNQVDLETYKKSSVEGSANNSFSGNAFGQQAMGKASESSPQAWGRENKGRSSPSWGTSTTSWDSTSCSKGSMNSWSSGFGSKSKEEAASRG